MYETCFLLHLVEPGSVKVGIPLFVNPQGVARPCYYVTLCPWIIWHELLVGITQSVFDGGAFFHHLKSAAEQQKESQQVYVYNRGQVCSKNKATPTNIEHATAPINTDKLSQVISTSTKSMENSDALATDDKSINLDNKETYVCFSCFFLQVSTKHVTDTLQSLDNYLGNQTSSTAGPRPTLN